MDICGAMALKTHFQNVITVYIGREKRDLLTSVLEKEISTEEKVTRLMAIEREKKNADICDYVVRFSDYDDAVRQIREGLGLKPSPAAD